MKIKDELFLSFPDKGTLPDDTIINVSMKIGTYRQIVSEPIITIDLPTSVDKISPNTHNIEPRTGQIWKAKYSGESRILDVRSRSIYLRDDDHKIQGRMIKENFKLRYEYVSG